MAENRHGMRFARVPVRGVPTLYKLSAIVPRQMVTGTPGALNLVQGVTKYKDWALADGEMIADCGEFTFSDAGNLEWQNETQQFLWNPTISAEDAARPRKVWHTTKVVHWPTVIYKVQISDDPAPFARLLISKREAATLSSVVRHEVFVRNIDWSPAELACGEPITDSPSFGYGSQQFSLPECLHPYLEFPAAGGGQRIVWDATPQVPGNLLGPRTFQPTNMEDWEEYITSQEVDEDNGLFIMHRQTVLPPENLPNELLA